MLVLYLLVQCWLEILLSRILDKLTATTRILQSKLNNIRTVLGHIKENFILL
uniref:Uncharacterized protein n=1 Tax=Octopus bimaculoides TaxID=37653 RepID=A0A0L8FJ72_OCTBM